jgi:hypothetical protein
MLKSEVLIAYSWSDYEFEYSSTTITLTIPLFIASRPSAVLLSSVGVVLGLSISLANFTQHPKAPPTMRQTTFGQLISHPEITIYWRHWYETAGVNGNSVGLAGSSTYI